MTRPERLEVGYVARAHGIQGELGIKTFDPASDALSEVAHIILVLKSGAERTFTLAGVRNAKDSVLVDLEGIATRTEAETLVGARVYVPRAELAPPAEGEYFQGDLVGLAAVTEQGAPLGVVEEVWNTGPVPNLVIRKDGAELIVPFADEFVLEVDLAKGQLIVRPPQLVD